MSSHPGSGEDLPPCKRTKTEWYHPSLPLQDPGPKSRINQPQNILVGHFLGTGLSRTHRGTETLTDIPRDSANMTPPERQGNPPSDGSPGELPICPAHLLLDSCGTGSVRALGTLPSALPGRAQLEGGLTLLWPPPGATCSWESSQTAPRLRARLMARMAANSRALRMVPRRREGQGRTEGRRVQHACRRRRRSVTSSLS